MVFGEGLSLGCLFLALLFLFLLLFLSCVGAGEDRPVLGSS